MLHPFGGPGTIHVGFAAPAIRAKAASYCNHDVEWGRNDAMI